MRIEPRASNHQWLWFVGLWLVGVLSMLAVSTLFRAIISSLS